MDVDLEARTRRIILASIIALALIVRFVYFLSIADHPFVEFPKYFTESDMYAFWQWAEEIREGDWMGRNTYHPYFDWMKDIAPLETWYQLWRGKEIFHQAPFYPYFLAGVLEGCQGSFPCAIFIQLLLGAIQPIIMYGLASYVFGIRVGLIAAALTALYAPFIFYEGVFLRDWLPPLVEPLALYLSLRAGKSRQWMSWGLAGGVLGLAILIKPSILLFVPVLGLWILIKYHPSWQQGSAAILCLLAGIVLCLTPLMMRNTLVGAPMLALSNRGPIGFVSGHFPDKNPVGPSRFTNEQAQLLARAGGTLGGVIKELWKEYHGNYSLFFKRQIIKIQGLFDPFEIPNNINFYYATRVSPVLNGMLRYGLIVSLGLAGLVVAMPFWRRHLLLVLYLFTTVGGLLLTLILARYRLILAPVWIVYASFFIAWVYHKIRTNQVLSAGKALLGWLGISVLIYGLMPLSKNPVYLRPQEYILAGRIYTDHGQWQKAVEEAEQLLALVQNHPTLGKFINIARAYQLTFRGTELYYKDNNIIGAVERLNEALTLVPTLQEAHYQLGLILLKENPPLAQLHLELFLDGNPRDPQARTAQRALETIRSP